MDAAEQRPAGLPAELESFLNDWFRSGADGGWEEFTPSLSADWDAPRGHAVATDAKPAEKRTTSSERDVLLTPLQAKPVTSPITTSVSSPKSTGGADGSFPTTNGDNRSEKGEQNSLTAAGDVGEKTLGKPARNASRERMKNELSYLRQRALELETQLAGLKSRSSAVDNLSESQDVGLRSVWKQIAERQLERRRHIESENDRLKGMLTEYLALARRLEQFLYKRPRPEQLANNDSNTNLLLKKSRMASAIDVDDAALVQRFVLDLGGLLAVVDSVLEASNALDAPSSSSDRFLPVLKANISSNGDRTSFLELSNSCVIPFPFERVCKAAWVGAKQRYQRIEYVTYDVNLPEDTIAVRYPLYYQECAADNIVVLRRYVSKDRMVWVWRSLSECSDECRHLLTDETGWSVFQSASAATPGSSSTTTMQSCIHVVPIQRVTHTPVDPTPSEFSELSAMLNNSYVDDEDGVTALVADLLLDEPLGFK